MFSGCEIIIVEFFLFLEGVMIGEGWGCCMWALILKETGEMIRDCGLMPVAEVHVDQGVILPSFHGTASRSVPFGRQVSVLLFEIYQQAIGIPQYPSPHSIPRCLPPLCFPILTASTD